MASPSLPRPALAKMAPRLLAALLACAFLGMASKPLLTVRFYVEANERDTDKFSQPITFRHPERKGYIERVPSIHERHIKAVFPFRAADGTWGCAFQLDASGRINLEVLSTERRGTSLVAFIGTKGGVHQAVELLIDKPIRDGVLSIPNGLTELEIGAIIKAFPVLGQKKRA